MAFAGSLGVSRLAPSGAAPLASILHPPVPGLLWHLLSWGLGDLISLVGAMTGG